jgi:sensor histidine kinase YesM
MIKLYGGEKRFRISLTDNGQGFPEDVLERINRGQALTQDGEHVGITNCIRRMNLLYGASSSLLLENRKPCGACVILEIPCTYI